MKKEIITIAGSLGSGKSSTAKLLAQKLNYQHFSSGDLFREIAAQQEQSLLDANVAAEKDSTIDHLVDQRLREIGQNENKKVIDSRTAWHWIPQSFKVYLELPTHVAAERIIAKIHERDNANEIIPESVEEYASNLEERLTSENKRYMTLYNIDPSIRENYDLVIDTSKHCLEEVANIICSTYTNWLHGGEGEMDKIAVGN